MIKLFSFRSLFIWSFAILLNGLLSCNEGTPDNSSNSVSITEMINQPETIDSVKIGNQIWMKKNLNTDKFQNGELIYQAKSSEDWDKATLEKEAAWCYYEFDSANEKKYGRLYNWYAVNNPKGLAPKGWHIPSDKEWDQLTEFLEGKEMAGHKMKSEEGWQNNGYENGNGSNESGFSALPGGHLTLGFAKFAFMNGGYGASFWTSTPFGDDAALDRRVYNSENHLHKSIYGESKFVGMSVRCVKD